MKYYAIRVMKKNDGTGTNSIMEFDGRDAAEIRFHTALAADMATDAVVECLHMVINSSGFVEMSRNWERKIEEVSE